MWADNETKEDLLGFKVHSDLIKEVVLDKELSPVVIGVFGDWGSGKSSVMQILQSDLEDEEDIAFLYFNGWLFEGYDDAKAALLESILEKLSDDKRFGDKIKDECEKLIKSVDWMRAVRLGFKNVGLPVLAAYLTGGTSLIATISDKLLSLVNEAKEDPDALVEKLQGDEFGEEVKKLIKKNKEEPEIGVKKFRKEFKKMLDKTGIKTLIVVIDDLDRCSPERIVDNLEAIKLFLNVENTAFVIGADQRLVQQAVKSKYSDDERLSKEYLEKVIQIPYHLPKLSDSEVETYMSLLFCKKELSPEVFGNVINAFHLFRESDRYSGFGFGNIKECLNNDGEEITDLLEEKLRMVHTISPLITKGLEGNPRQIKRYLNAFILRKKLAVVAKLPSFTDDVLAKLMILEYVEESFFKQLYNWQAVQDGFPSQIKALEKACVNEKIDEEAIKSVDERWKKGNVIKWIQLEPKLSEIDLRDYFWITRDRLSDSMPGALMIPPEVKTVIQELYATPTDTTLDKKIKESIKDLWGDNHITHLYTELKARTLKNPEDKKHYDIYYFLVKNEIPQSVESYLEILDLVEKSVPPGVAFNLIELGKEHQTLSERIKQIEQNNSKLGRAIKAQTKPKSKKNGNIN